LARTAQRLARHSFSRLKHVLDHPNLIDIQRESLDFFRFLKKVWEDDRNISPIEDYTGSLAVEFGEYRFGSAVLIQECREKDLTYRLALDDGPIREPGHGRDPRADVFMGDLPMLTDMGDVHHSTGHERVIVGRSRAFAGRLT